jgi:rhodanese-related sulfurtransferase
MGTYAGDVNTAQAWEILSTQQNSVLIDVRTPAEWQFSGVPTLKIFGKEVFFIPWLNYPTFDFNERFFPTFAELNLTAETPILFLCKVGGRSRDAAVNLATQGFAGARSIEWGFEGAHNELGQRGRVNGWKAAGLPWEQA